MGRELAGSEISFRKAARSRHDLPSEVYWKGQYVLSFVKEKTGRSDKRSLRYTYMKYTRTRDEVRKVVLSL